MTYRHSILRRRRVAKRTSGLARDPYRRTLVTSITNSANGAAVETLAYAYDALNRPTTRNADTFGYNDRSEVTSATIGGIANSYGYDEIGNNTDWMPNNLNQYSEFTYDLDGNLLTDGIRTFTYDAANRLKTVSVNGVLALTNFYDAKSRRVRKVTPEAATTFFYDDWNLIEERIAYTNGTTSTIHYYWGKDLSGSLQGAGGVGGLLYLTADGVPYIPTYDNNGNITRYLNANGNTVAQYTYDAFGNTISQSGPLASFFRHRFSTKYFDHETGLYYYGYRFYHPILMRWLTRDPLEEDGGVNFYTFCDNNGIYQIDRLGLYLWYVLYYDEPNNSNGNFKRAAETCKNNIEKSSHFNSKCDSVEMYSIQTTNDFFRVWTTLNAHSRRKSKRVTRYQVKGLHLFTHSGSGKLYLFNSTAQASQIKTLPALNWAPKAEIHCLGCNSGVENGSGDSLAGSFYESQKVPATGQSASSSFSSNPTKKSKWGVVLGFSDVYLWAFDKNGNKMPPVQYPKEQENSR